MAVQKISQLTSLTSNEVTSSIDLLAIVDTTNSETKKITIDDLLSGGEYSVSGSFSGSFQGDGTNITGVTGEWDGSHNGNASITGSLTVTSDISSSTQVYGSRLNAAAYVQTPQINGVGGDIIFMNGLNITGNITSSGDISSSADVYGVTGSFLHLLGDGSQLTGVTSEWDGTLNGNAEITGSLIVTGDITGSNISASSLLVTGDITGSNISASNTVYGITGSFSHLLGSSPLTVESDNFNIDSSGNITSSANISASGDLYSDNLTTTGTIVKKSGNGQTTYFPEIDSASTVGNQTSTCGIFGVDTDKITTCIIRVGCKIAQASANKGGYFEFCYTYSNDGGGNILPIGSKTDIIDQATTGLSADVQNNAGSISIQVTSTNVGENYSWRSSVEKIVLV